MSEVDLMYDNLLETLRGEFVDEAEDNINSLELLLEAVRRDASQRKDGLTQIRRVAHSLKGSSGVASFPLVTLVMHRLEDYLSTLSDLEDIHLDHVQIYLDKAREYANLSVDQNSVSSAELARMLPSLPMHGTPDVASHISGKIIEALMVTKEKMAARIFERELRMAGLRVSTVRDEFSAMEMIVRTRPDLVVMSAVLDDSLSGVDLACALVAMPATRDIPVCMLTSFERDHHDLRDLPEQVCLIRKSHLKEDLDEVLSGLVLLGGSE